MIDGEMDRKRRHGPEPLPASEKRSLCVSVRLNAAELALLDEKRGRLARGEWLRMAALDVVPPVVPEINQEAWFVLSKVAGNLSTLARAARDGFKLNFEEIRSEISSFRRALMDSKESMKK